jgi:cytochrome P450
MTNLLQHSLTLNLVAMRRLAKETVKLADDLMIKKGEYVTVNADNMWNSDIWPEPHKYDIYRHYRMRQDPATANKAHLVSTSPDHMAFGHGDQSCPGRFFAANEIKTALCHLLLKYDWELAPGASMEPFVLWAEIVSLNPLNKLRYRRRKEEVDLENLSFK